MMDRSAWRRPHGFPDLPGGEVHIWRARLDGVCRADEVMPRLSADERARSERFVFDRDRRRRVDTLPLFAIEVLLCTGQRPATVDGQRKVRTTTPRWGLGRRRRPYGAG